MTRPDGAAPGRFVVSAAVAATALFLLVCTVAPGGLLDDEVHSDVALYDRYGQRMIDGDLPYRDFYVEYPPGALPAFVAPAALDLGYSRTFRSLMIACGVGAIAAAAAAFARLGARRRRVAFALAVVALSPLLLGAVYLNRFDLWPTLFVACSLATLLTGRTRLAAGLLGYGFAAKIFPAAAVPVVALYVWRRYGRRATATAAGVFAAVSAAVFVPFGLIAPGGVAYSLYSQASRPLQFESLGASLLLGADKLGAYAPTFVPGSSLNLGGHVADAVGIVSFLLQVAAVAAIAVAYARGPDDPERLVAAFAASIAAFVAFGKVFSPQFLIWLVPLVPLVRGTAGRLATACLVAALLVTHRGWHFGDNGDYSLDWNVWVWIVRNLLVVGVVAVLLAALARRATHA